MSEEEIVIRFKEGFLRLLAHPRGTFKFSELQILLSDEYPFKALTIPKTRGVLMSLEGKGIIQAVKNTYIVDKEALRKYMDEVMTKVKKEGEVKNE